MAAVKNGGVGDGLVVCFGEMLIDFVPTEAGLSLADATAFLKVPGGAPANVAIAVTRLGGRGAFMGKLGDDEFGHMLAAILRENGVSDAGVVFEAAARTALAFVTLRVDGEREFMFYRHPSADMLLTDAELNVDVIRRASIFHYGSLSLITEPCRSAHHKAMKMAREAGALLSYDPNLRLQLWSSPEEARKQIFSIWDDADIVKVSEAELSFLTGKDSLEDEVVMQLWRPNFKLLLVTLGGEGCKYYTKDFRGIVGSFSIKQVDSTGAGDAFVGGMLQGIVEERSALQDEKKLRQVLRFANACGAITATKKGAIPSLPNVSEVKQFLEKERIAAAERECGSSSVADNDALAQVLGKEHSGRVRGMGFGVSPTQVFTGSSSHVGTGKSRLRENSEEQQVTLGQQEYTDMLAKVDRSNKYFDLFFNFVRTVYGGDTTNLPPAISEILECQAEFQDPPRVPPAPADREFVPSTQEHNIDSDEETVDGSD